MAGLSGGDCCQQRDPPARQTPPLVHTISAHAQPAGPVTRKAFDTLSAHVVDAARAHQGQLHGIQLGLHQFKAVGIDPAKE